MLFLGAILPPRHELCLLSPVPSVHITREGSIVLVYYPCHKFNGVNLGTRVCIIFWRGSHGMPSARHHPQALSQNLAPCPCTYVQARTCDFTSYTTTEKGHKLQPAMMQRATLGLRFKECCSSPSLFSLPPPKYGLHVMYVRLFCY